MHCSGTLCVCASARDICYYFCIAYVAVFLQCVNGVVEEKYYVCDAILENEIINTYETSLGWSVCVFFKVCQFIIG